MKSYLNKIFYTDRLEISKKKKSVYCFKVKLICLQAVRKKSVNTANTVQKSEQKRCLENNMDNPKQKQTSDRMSLAN